MPSLTPVIDPNQRPPDDVPAADSYRPADPVWVWPPGDAHWRPGVVDAASPGAVLVTFQRPGGGTGVDSLLARHVMPRVDRVEDLDARIPNPRLPSRPRGVQHATVTAAVSV